MKRVLFFIVFVLIGLCSYAQVSLKINSIDMSRRDKIQERPDVIKLIANGYPSFRIEATVTNNSQDSIWIRYHDYSGPEDVQLQFYDYGRYYYKSLSWILKYDDNLLLPPHTKRKVVFWTTIPTETEVPEPSLGLRPWHWRWDTKDPQDKDYLKWFERILPSMKVSVVYGKETGNPRILVSEPLDYQAIEITSNLSAEKSVDVRMSLGYLFDLFNCAVKHVTKYEFFNKDKGMVECPGTSWTMSQMEEERYKLIMTNLLMNGFDYNRRNDTLLFVFSYSDMTTSDPECVYVRSHQVERAYRIYSFTYPFNLFYEESSAEFMKAQKEIPMLYAGNIKGFETLCATRPNLALIPNYLAVRIVIKNGQIVSPSCLWRYGSIGVGVAG